MYLHKLIIDKSTGYRNNLYIEYMGVCVAIIISVQYTDFLVFRLIESFIYGNHNELSKIFSRTQAL